MLTNRRTVRIEWGDCDPAGIIYYPRYFEIFDASVNALFERGIGMTKYQMLQNFKFTGYPSIATSARFVRPIRFGDDVVVESTIRFKTSSFHVDHRVIKAGDLAAEGAETRVWVITDPADPNKLKASPIPRELIDRMTVG